MRSIKSTAVVPLLLLPVALLLAGCDVGEMAADSSDQSTEKSAKTSEKAVEKGLLPEWVPSGGTDVKLVQRNSGPERIFIVDYPAEIDVPQCVPLDDSGEPTDQELARAYASDSRTKNFDPSEMSTTRTLEADWWPAGAESRTTDLCGRFWVHQADGRLYAFTPDTKVQVKSVLDERASQEKEGK
ncbi:hypothetical protein SLW73_17720 [Glutamicibacter protophormiae]|uniref:hypothetical protein n=1 Tax=Glutamicibacter protophormiae TaxID=37930 RepID=UPI002A81416F|nr:hypothetical protein [Glutamicibacter protophormiae]WPR68195.1 hypothetical protein SLW73_17720 [Glutamicibacter protophormiae]